MLKPEEWQKREALEKLLRSTEFRACCDMSIADILSHVGLIQLDDLIKTLDSKEVEQ